MANGAAGCGFEYRNTNGMCGHLQMEGETFRCTRHLEELQTQRFTGHPFRCGACSATAHGSLYAFRQQQHNMNAFSPQADK